MCDASLHSPVEQSKFGDSDLASKRRKDNDEYNTIFTKRLSKPELNSTLNETDDYNGGILPENDDWKPCDLISPNPSDSSFGFENTFSILEGQLRGTQQLTRSQVEHLLRTSDLQKNPIFLDVPFASKDRFLRAISEEKSIGDDDEVDSAEQKPSFLELELDARQRIKELSFSINDSEKVKSTSDTLPDEELSTSSMNEFLYGIPSKSTADQRSGSPMFQSMVHEDRQQQSGEYPEYVYHVAKGKDGQVYLRVVRSLLVDKGNNSIIVFTPNYRNYL